MSKNIESNKNVGIKSWLSSDRPREKLQSVGRRGMSDAELLAILIRSGNQQESAVSLSNAMLKHYNYDLGKLAKADVSDLCLFTGIGPAKALSIIAALEIGRRRRSLKEKVGQQIFSSKDVYNLVYPIFADLLHEEFWIILLNRANKIQSQQRVSIGGFSSTIADPKVIFKMALQHSATSIILAHNHPSGQLSASDDDVKITAKLVEAGKSLDINVFDHVIITDHGYFSFADEGMI